MPPLADLQSAFAIALLDADRTPPEAVVGPDGGSAGKRFNVYRNNVVVSLVESLAAAYPAVWRLVGEEFFRAAAGVYVRREPPRSPVVIDYGASFGAFLDRFEPAQSVPYLGDVARLEWAWNRAYYAADGQVLNPSALAAIDADRLATVRFTMHPATQVVRSAFPIVTLFHANRGDAVADAVRLPDGGEDALVTRADMEVEVRGLPAGGGVFAEALQAGRPLSSAAVEAQEAASDFDLSGNLAVLLRSGAATSLTDTAVHGEEAGG